MDLQRDPSFFFYTQYLSSVFLKKHLKQEYHNKAKKKWFNLFKYFKLLSKWCWNMCFYSFRQQLQELRLKQEQNEHYQRRGRRRDSQGETAGEGVKPRRAPSAPTPISNCDPALVRLCLKMQYPRVTTRGRHSFSPWWMALTLAGLSVRVLFRLSK